MPVQAGRVTATFRNGCSKSGSRRRNRPGRRKSRSTSRSRMKEVKFKMLPSLTGGSSSGAVLKCPRCGQVISAEDTLAFSGNKIFHLDCRRPRDLSIEERALLFRYCPDHVIAKCVACAASFTQHELVADLVASRSSLCPRCRADLTASMRAHLYTCTVVPHEIRLSVQAVRDAARILVKQSGEHRQRADMLMRVAEVAMAKLRETMARAAATELRQVKVRGSG